MCIYMGEDSTIKVQITLSDKIWIFNNDNSTWSIESNISMRWSAFRKVLASNV